MKTACPSCGADVEFRYDDSFVRVCSYCHAAVQRTDRGVESLGTFADIAPTDSPLRLFAEGTFGGESFMLVGLAQLRHAAGGSSQEWYARFSDRWGWLAEAQGRFYMTFEVEGVAIPPTQPAPGDTLDLPIPGDGTRTFTVGEVNASTYVAASGELPFRLTPELTYRFADLADGDGSFATIDYGEYGTTEPPTLYVGRQCTLGELHISGGEVGPPRTETVASKRLACPNCNAPIEIRAGDQTLRVACAYCGELLDVAAGSLAIIGAQRSKKVAPQIPLGSVGTFSEGELTLIGFCQRSASIEGEWYPFDEYLLYAPAIGFRWLVCSDSHWSYVQPIATGAVEDGAGTTIRYDGVTLRLFQSATLRVDAVAGEFYWQVKIDDVVQSQDFVAPPAMISREQTTGEQTWSLSTYMKVADVEAAFGNKHTGISAPVGVAPNQPDPLHGVATPLTLAFVALLVLGIFFAATSNPRTVFEETVPVPIGAAVTPEPSANNPDPVPSNVYFSSPFELVGGKNIELGFNSSLSNNWVYVVASLVNTATGDVYTVDGNMEHYSGVEDGESWSEGDPTAREVIGPVAPGAYVIRLEMQQGGTMDTFMTVRARQGVFRGKYLAWALAVLGIPFLIFGTYTYSFERKRWTNSSEGASGAPKTGLTLMVGGIVLVLGGIVAIIKAIAESSSND